MLPHRGGGGETYIRMLEPLPGYEHRRFYLSSGRRPANALASLPIRWPQLAACLRQTDLVHSHGDAASVIVLPLLRARPAVMTTHGLNLVRRLGGARQAVMARGLAAVAASCHAVICTSVSERDELAPIVRNSDLHKLRVILNGIDPPNLMDESEREAVRSELGIAPSTILGLFVGQLEPNKAPLIAAAAAIRVRAAGSPFVLAIVGDGPQAGQLHDLASDALRILGYRSDVQRLLSAADVFVHPSEREGMSFALLEAMGHALPVVAASGAGTPEVVGDAGVLFETGDEPGLAATLMRLSADPALRASLGEKARMRAEQQFSAADSRAATEAIYEQSLWGSHRTS